MREAPKRVDPRSFGFLAMFFARAHRRLYRPLSVGSLGEDLGFSTDAARGIAGELARRGLLREVSALAPRGPSMEITPAGIAAVRSSLAARVREAAART